MRDGILLAEDSPASLIQTHHLLVSTDSYCTFVYTLSTDNTSSMLSSSLLLQTLEEVFLKLCKRQEEDKALGYDVVTIVS